MDGLTGLAGLQSLEVDTPDATPEERMGYPANPAHEHRGEVAKPYIWESPATQSATGHGPYGGEITDDLIQGQEDYYVLAAGTLDNDPYAEREPWTHAAPWPKDVIGDGSVQPDNAVRQAMDNYQVRQASKPDSFAKSNVYSRAYALQDHWQEIWEVNPNGVDLSEVPAQMRSGAAPGGRGHTDRTQSNAHQNQYGFDSRHMHRRFAEGSIPGNYMYLKPGGRPMVKSLAGPARPAIGKDSPFAGDSLGTAFGIDGAILQTPATEYQAPPQPYVAPSQQGTSDDSVPSYLDDYGIGG